MAIIYLVRHGLTNAGNILVGRSASVYLSEVGIQQVKNTANKLKDIKFDLFYCSPLERTMQTADIINKYLNMEITYSDNLLEVDFGAWTNKAFDDLKHLERWKQYYMFRSGTKAPHGENIIEVQARIVNLIEKLTDENKEGRILLVSHGDPIRAAVSYYGGIHIENMLKVRIDLASISILNITEWKSEIIGCNILDELPQ